MEGSELWRISDSGAIVNIFIGLPYKPGYHSHPYENQRL